MDTIKPEKAALFSVPALRRLLIPLLLEQLLAISMGIIDTVMLSAVGEAAVSGVSLVDLVNNLLINVFAALATGGAVIVSQYIGCRKPEKGSVAAAQLLYVLLAVSLLLTVLTLFSRRGILQLLFGSVEADVRQAAVTYLTVTALSFPFIAIYNGAAALFRSMGNARISMYASLVVNVLNIIGNALAIFVFGWGVAGAALSTVLSRAAAMLFLLFRLRDPRLPIRFSLRHLYRPSKPEIRKILYVGLPGCLENSLFQLGRVLTIRVITLFGTVQISANAVAQNINSLAVLPGVAVGLALITVVGQCIGADAYDQAQRYARRLIRLSYILMWVLGALLLLTLPLTLRLYQVSPEAIELGTRLIFIHVGAGFLLWPLAFVMPNVMKASGDVRFTMCVAISSMLIFRIALSYLLGSYFGWGAIGVFTAMVADWICRAAFFLWRFLSGKWKRAKLVS